MSPTEDAFCIVKYQVRVSQKTHCANSELLPLFPAYKCKMLAQGACGENAGSMGGVNADLGVAGHEDKDEEEKCFAATRLFEARFICVASHTQ